MREIVNKICGELPEGFEISLCMENGAAWVTLHDPEGERIELPDTADTTITQQLKEALYRAKECLFAGTGMVALEDVPDNELPRMWERADFM